MTHQPHEPFLLLGTSQSGKLILSGTDFEQHKVCSGISGSGKSTLLAWIAVSLLRQGIAFSLVDPHGDLCRLILQLLMSSDFFSHRKSFDRLWFVDFNRTDAAIPFNVLSAPGMDSHSIANGVLEAIHRAFPSVGTTAALDNTFLAATYVLTENHRPITDLQKLLLDTPFRKSLLRNISDPLVVQFFESKLAEKANSTLVDSTLRRSFLLTFSPHLRNTLSQVENKLNFRTLMDSGISCLFTLGGLDDESKRLLGCFLMVHIEQAFLSRASVSPDRRFPYHVIVDEFPLFSASGDSFSVVLEQCRKYGGTLYLAHQTQHQIKSVAGSLQNAIPIVLKAGTDDSSALASRFYRPQQEEQVGLFSFTSAPPSLFSGVSNTTEARMLFEQLARQEAIVTLNGKAQRITTPTLPIGTRDHKKLTELENAYARHLLTPIKDIGKEQTSSKLYLVPTSPMLQRRTHTPAQKRYQPFHFLTGELEEDIRTAFTHFYYLTLDQLTALLGKKEGNKNYLRKKLNSMIDVNTIAVTQLARLTGGKPLQVYYLAATGERKHTFLEHTLDCNEVLIAGLTLPTVEPSITVVDMKHERTLKALLSSSPCIPDGLLSYQTQQGELINIAIEIDRATENSQRLEQKFTSSSAWMRQMGLETLTLAFLVTTGDRKRVSYLMEIANEVTSDLASICLFAAVAGDKITPALFTDPIFKGLDNVPRALFEQPF